MSFSRKEIDLGQSVEESGPRRQLEVEMMSSTGLDRYGLGKVEPFHGVLANISVDIDNEQTIVGRNRNVGARIPLPNPTNESRIGGGAVCRVLEELADRVLARGAAVFSARASARVIKSPDSKDSETCLCVR
jgi:hypothetical protein